MCHGLCTVHSLCKIDNDSSIHGSTSWTPTKDWKKFGCFSFRLVGTLDKNNLENKGFNNLTRIDETSLDFIVRIFNPYFRYFRLKGTKLFEEIENDRFFSTYIGAQIGSQRGNYLPLVLIEDLVTSKLL